MRCSVVCNCAAFYIVILSSKAPCAARGRSEYWLATRPAISSPVRPADALLRQSSPLTLPPWWLPSVLLQVFSRCVS
ncbi:hypothetical protein BDZ91DRAFT_715018 [Kalaharituber pfeilii]|nr:hypothetical protein BDZ91DRAFT_715018 [Kalaharituber pfeilii]